MVLMDYVFSKYMPDQHQIVFLRMESDFLFILKSKEFCAELQKLISNDITYSQFKLCLSNEALLEFETAWLELKKFGIVKSDDVLMGPGKIMNGTFFSFHIELAAQDISVSAYMSEGAACSTLGETFCETNPSNTNYPRELWECIASPDLNWAAMGVSC